MSSVNKLLSKINQATTTIKSVKGISSKIFGTGYQSDVSKFEQDSLEYQTNLATRAKALKEGSSNITALSRKESKRKPPEDVVGKELVYPRDYKVDNYIHFIIKKRQTRNGDTGKNALSGSDTHIYMYAPNVQNNAPNVNYKNVEFGNFSRALLNSEKFISRDMAAGLGAEINEAFVRASNALQFQTRDFANARAFNPQLEIMFDGMTFRTFDMQFQFRPNSVEESNVVREIIYTLKTAMLPDTFNISKESGGLGAASEEFSENYFNTPNLFEIEYVGPISDKIDGFLPSFLTACNVTYNGGSKIETFDDGTPLIIDMTLSFQENVVMTQEQYQLTNKEFGVDLNAKKTIKQGGAITDGREADYFTEGTPVSEDGSLDFEGGGD